MSDRIMDRLEAQVARLAPLDVTLLLSGETGSGKSRLARQIHEMSPRHDQPFLTVNCGALSETLIESEMFGHVRGAFTGADRDRAGKFAEVGRGTLFLDDVDLLPVALQAKLLRVVEERVFEPVGSNKSQPMAARLIAASNRELDREAAAGRFRADLYYRLNVVGLQLPPLRDRRAAIPDLACSLLEDIGRRMGRDGLCFDEMALWALQEYDWPGNVRELRNVVERAVALSARAVIDCEDFPESIRLGVPPTAAATSRPIGEVAVAMPGRLAEAAGEAESARILRALERQGNNRLRAAAELGISRMTLYKKLHKYGLMQSG